MNSVVRSTIAAQIGAAIAFGFTPLPGLAVSSLLCGVNRLRKRFAKEGTEA